MATLSPSLFPQIAKEGIEETANIFAMPGFIKSHKNNIFSTLNSSHFSNTRIRLWKFSWISERTAIFISQIKK